MPAENLALAHLVFIEVLSRNHEFQTEVSITYARKVTYQKEPRNHWPIRETPPHVDR